MQVEFTDIHHIGDSGLHEIGMVQGRIQDFKWGGEISEKKISNTHPYSINKLSTKKNTQKSLFFNILRYNHLSTKTKKTRNTIVS